MSQFLLNISLDLRKDKQLKFVNLNFIFYNFCLNYYFKKY